MSVGVVMFHLPPERVWRLTPAQYAALSKVVDEDRRSLDFQLGWIRMLLAEPYRDRQRTHEPFKPTDFTVYKQKGATQSTPASREMTPDQMLAHVRGCVIPFFKAREEALKARQGEN